VIQKLNTLPGPKKVLFWWTDGAPGAFYLNGQAASNYSYFASKLFTEDSGRILDTLVSNGVTHVITAQGAHEGDLMTNPEGTFVRQHLRKIYEKNAVILYEVSPQPLWQDWVAYDLLGHLDEAQIEMPLEPAAKRHSDYRMVVGIGEDYRYALTSFPPAAVEFTVAVPEHAALHFAIGRQYAPCDSPGTFAVQVQTADGNNEELYRRELRAGNARDGIGWYEEQVELGAYGGQTVRLIFQNAYQGRGACNWFLWADPKIVATPVRD
jgi:hypothetical protein